MNFQITIMLTLVSFILLFIVAPSAWMMSQGLDQRLGLLGDVLTLLPPLPILLLALFTSYQALVNTVCSLSGKPIRYLLSIPFAR